MASSGPLYPGTAASLANAGTSEDSNAWVSPANVGANDATEASITAATFDSPDIGELLVASNFGFAIPTGATIDGIEVTIDRRSIIAGSGKDFRAQLGKGTAFANLVGTNKADTVTIWPSTSTGKIYGLANDLWGTTWTPAEINASSFAFFLSAQAAIANADIGLDFIRVTVTYTESAPSGTGAISVPAATVTGTGALVLIGSGAIAIPVAAIVGSGNHTAGSPEHTGTGAITAPVGTIAGSGTAEEPSVGTSRSRAGGPLTYWPWVKRMYPHPDEDDEVFDEDDLIALLL